jgi:CRISPR-associated protein Cmr2
MSTDGTERLDAIDTVKRFAFLSKSFRKKFYIPDRKAGLGFPSTSSIAVAPFLERLILAYQTNTSQLPKVIDHWIKESRQLGDIMPETIPFLTKIAAQHKQSHQILALDGDCLFPETFHPQRLKREFGFDDTRAEVRARLAKSGPDALSNLFKETDGLSILRPTPYYAMIQMDGDKMGRLINGVQSKTEHQNISRALSEFSREHAPTLVENSYPGRLIYAGGDDVFALAPLARDILVQDGEVPQIRTVLDLVDRLQQRYRDVVRPEVIDHDVQSTEPNKKSRKESVTASIGIAIAHHQTSLSYVRRVSKEAEQLAKKHYGRNALVVTVLRRSGEQTRVGCRWEYPNPLNQSQTIRPIPLFLAFYKLFKDDVLSPKCVYNLLEEAPTLVGLSQKAQVSEVRRILRRQRNPALEEGLSDEEILQKAQSLIALAGAMDKDEYPHNKEQELSVELHAEKRRYGLIEVLGWLLVMLFLARKEQE